MKKLKTPNLFFSLLIFVSLISFFTIECIDHRFYKKTTLEIQELNKTKDQLVMKFEVFSHIVEKMVDVVHKRI